MKKYFLGLITIGVLGLSQNVSAVRIIDRMSATEDLDLVLKLTTGQPPQQVLKYEHTFDIKNGQHGHRETFYTIPESDLLKFKDLIERHPISVSIRAESKKGGLVTESHELTVLKSFSDLEQFQSDKSTISIISYGRSSYTPAFI